MSRELTAKQRRFVEVYDGNGTQSARLAGYTGSDNTLAQTARDLLRNPQVVEAIRERQRTEVRPLVASRHDRQAFWTDVMLDPDQGMFTRLKASEYLAKSEADFVTRVEHSGHVTLEQLVAASFKADAPEPDKEPGDE